jgi:hypothetical protein
MRHTRTGIFAIRTHAARGLFVLALVIGAGAASCASQGYYESTVAARTAYEAAESAKAAAYAATVAALDMHESNLRATRAVGDLTTALTGPAKVRGDGAATPVGAGTVLPAPARTDGQGSHMGVVGGNSAEQAAEAFTMQTVKALAPAVSPFAPEVAAEQQAQAQGEEPAGVVPLVHQTNATLERVIASQDRLTAAAEKIGAASERIVTQTEKVAASTEKLVASADKLSSKGDRVAASADVVLSRLAESSKAREETVLPPVVTPVPPRDDSHRTLALAFASFAIVAMLGVGWWTERARRASRESRDWGDWLLVSSAGGAAVTSIGLIGALYFAVRIFKGEPQDNPLWNIPWQTMAWLWASMVLVGLLGMWIMALAGFWSRLGDVDHTRRAQSNVVEVPSTRHEVWRLWVAVLVIGVVPALGMLAMARADLLLDMFLVLVFAVFGGAAVLLSGREEVASRPARHAST